MTRKHDTDNEDVCFEWSLSNTTPDQDDLIDDAIESGSQVAADLVEVIQELDYKLTKTKTALVELEVLIQQGAEYD